MRPLLKPRILLDINRVQRQSVFATPSFRVNLAYHPKRQLPILATAKVIVSMAAVMTLLFGSVSAPTTNLPLAKGAVAAADERADLEAQLADLEKQINQYEGQITSYQKQGSSLKGEITRLNDKVAKLNLQIRAINLTLTQLDRKIDQTKSQISVTEASIASNREALGELLRSIDLGDQETLVEIFLKNPQISDFFNDVNSVSLLQSNIRVTISRISDLKTDLESRQEELSLARADAATIQAYQSSQKTEADSLKQEKNTILTQTKGQESKYQQLLKRTKQTAAQIRSRIFELLGGGELTFEKAYNYAKVAGDATGVRPALILAVLDRESALGKNVGRCNYKTAMSPDNRPVFLQLLSDLKIDPDSVNVSCANADGAYGGAMGPAQFVPKTWLMYQPQITKITGNAVPSPWSNADAFAATALYMKNAGAVGGSISSERIAAAKYYAGGNWKRFLWTYGEAVVSRAQKFQQDIATIEGN